MSTDARTSGVFPIRPATTADAAAIAEAAARMFIHTFGAENTPGDLAMYVAAAFGTSTQQHEIEDPSCTYLLAHDRGAIVAHALLRAGSRSAFVEDERQMELQRFYVDHRYHGRGLARQLMQECLTTANAAGGRILWLGVWQRNARAIAFYEKCGFAVVGQQHFLLGTDRQTDHVMMRSVSRDEPTTGGG